MKNNTLVVCGGTGAHVALALVRFHSLGQPLGFFRDADGKPLVFPTVYLVDQDSGDGDHEGTPWQRTRQLVNSHTGRHDWHAATGQSGPPELKVVTTLPVGSDHQWFNSPFDTLGRRFAGSPYLDLFTSQRQRNIRFSHGMMASPAVGSLLFRLKKFDSASSDADTNPDGAYLELRQRRGRIAVAGSAVGGTGASVAPTLAQQFADGNKNDGNKNDVMAVMVMNWFKFGYEGLDNAKLPKAQRRNRDMVQNADSALAYYGHKLARRVATVPVGAPDSAINDRRYTSDTGQSISESFLHGVAALCCLHHFLRGPDKPFPSGLYQMSAEDSTRLGGGSLLPGAGDHSLQSLANQAATLADVLDAFATALSSTPQKRGFFGMVRGLFGLVPAVYESVLDHARPVSPKQVGDALSGRVAAYREHLAWMTNVLGTEPQPDASFTLETRSREQLAKRPLSEVFSASNAGGPGDPDAAALALLHWTADWIRDCSGSVPPAKEADGGYWPPRVGHDATGFSAEAPGVLTKVEDQQMQGTVDGFVQEENLAQNGWPDPMAAAVHFGYAIKHELPTERRQLEMLLAGVVRGDLTLRDVLPPKEPALLSLETLVNECRQGELPELARVEVVKEHPDGDVVMGFSAPHTLFCPIPVADDENREKAWETLWEALTGSEQPREWRTEKISKWRLAERTVSQIRTWIKNEKKRHGGDAPPWTLVFKDHEDHGEKPTVTFGVGRTLSVCWGTGTETVPITLPTASSGNYWPSDGTTEIDEKELRRLVERSDKLLEQVKELKSVKTDGDDRFSMLTFTRPGSEKPTRAFWRAHLDHLQRLGKITAFGARADERLLVVRTARSVAVFDNTIVLERDEIAIRECRPMHQEPVPGSQIRFGEVLYPDYPLRSDYLGLVVMDPKNTTNQLTGPKDGSDDSTRRPRVLDLLKRGEGEKVPPGKPESARGFVKWKLHLAGRSQPVSFRVPVSKVDAAGGEDEHDRAHWLVWPRFRSVEAPYWRAYYVYEQCSVARLRLSTLWFDPDDDCIRRLAPPDRAGAYAVGFKVGDQRAHTGGPPIAFSLEDTQSGSGEELGLYVVRLQPLDRQRRGVKVGIDFGTSHTVAAVQVDGDKHLVKLSPELGSAAGHGPLTLPVSENASHVTDSAEGLKKLGVWLPTYTEDCARDMEGLLPSELLTIAPLASLTSKDPLDWEPGRHCVIPLMDMQRRDLADHLVADFKWKASFKAFRSREPALREVYLGMAMELIMADVAWQRLHALPAEVDFTFTYPLRETPAELESYKKTLRRLIEGGRRSLGGDFRLADGRGIYNESSAAKGGTDVFGEVCLVGDLGGGTLDLFISAHHGFGPHAGSKQTFEQVADSAKLGGNELLRTMAEHRDRFLPPSWSSKGDAQPLLRAWMRSKGSACFLGSGVGESEFHAGLGVGGFAEPKKARPARALIERYFRLIVEYMARSLVAYLVRHWYAVVLKRYPSDYKELLVIVQLRGNGWRLWPDNVSYVEIGREVAKSVEARARELWRDRAGDRDAWCGQDDLWRRAGLWRERRGATGRDGGPAVAAPSCSTEGSRSPNPKAAPIHPKAAPIYSVVGRAEEDDEGKHYSHALVQLKVRTPTGTGAKPVIHWFDRLPVRTGASDVKVEFHGIEPPFLLSHPDVADGARQELDDLEPNLKRDINHALNEGATVRGVELDAPIARLVWENAFKSGGFVEGRKGK